MSSLRAVLAMTEGARWDGTWRVSCPAPALCHVERSETSAMLVRARAAQRMPRFLASREMTEGVACPG